jgi:hypothetical protein
VPDTTPTTVPPSAEIVARPPDAPHRSGRRRTRHRRRGWRRYRWWLVGGAVVLVGLGAWTVVRYVQALGALSDGRTQALAADHLLTGHLSGLDQARLEAARVDLLQAEADFGERSALLQNGWVAAIATHLPGVGGNVVAAQALRTAGEDGARFGVDLVTLVERVIPEQSGPGNTTLFQRLVQLASADGAQITQTTAALNAFSQDLARIPGGTLLGPLQHARATLLSEGHRVAGVAGPAINLLKALPAAIGPGTHTYLLLLENPGEERPGGGFIGEVGVVTVINGAITTVFRPSEYWAKRLTGIPAPLEHLSHSPYWTLSDANWSPDFPTSARQVETFYQKNTGQSVDGVIDVDPVAMSYVLQVLGPVTAPPYSETITASNALMELNYLVNGRNAPGKSALDAFGARVVEEMLHAPIDRMPALAAALERGATEKHIAMYFNDASLERRVDGANFGGVVPAPHSDSLLVDNANLGGGKTDLFVTREYDLTARVQSDGRVADHLVLTYQDPVQTNPENRHLALEGGSGGAYLDYVRVYLPETATLAGMSLSIDGGHAHSVMPAANTHNLGREAIAYYLVVPYGGSATLTLDYSGPFAGAAVSPERYTLAWQKQINALTTTVQVSVTMPSGRTYHWSSSLVTDHTFSTRG